LSGNHLGTGLSTVEYNQARANTEIYNCYANNNYIVALLDGKIAKYTLLSRAFCKRSTLQI